MSYYKTVSGYLKSDGGLEGRRQEFELALPASLNTEDRARIVAVFDEIGADHDQHVLALSQKLDGGPAPALALPVHDPDDAIVAGLKGFWKWLREAQRTIWGYALLILDFFVFSGHWDLVARARQLGTGADAGAATIVGGDLLAAFWIVNFLVLGFLFGESAISNLLPQLKSNRADGSER
jgi:hypothetical protein